MRSASPRPRGRRPDRQREGRAGGPVRRPCCDTEPSALRSVRTRPVAGSCTPKWTSISSARSRHRAGRCRSADWRSTARLLGGGERVCVPGKTTSSRRRSHRLAAPLQLSAARVAACSSDRVRSKKSVRRRPDDDEHCQRDDSTKTRLPPRPMLLAPKLRSSIRLRTEGCYRLAPAPPGQLVLNGGCRARRAL